MLKNKQLTYISLFSSAGVGCYGFKKEDYNCIASNEIIEKRLNVQKFNNKCELESGYILGDISKSTTKALIFDEITKWEQKGNDGVDVIIATPPCQGISSINHKKNKNDESRNSLVVESVELIKKINPKFFIIENVLAFEKSVCVTKENKVIRIGNFIREELANEFVISSQVINFMNYGTKSSRTRTLMIGVNKKYKNDITPLDLYPDFSKEMTLKEVISNFPKLHWGEIHQEDFYHAFRIYKPNMRSWIKDLKEGESAFDNPNPINRPHKIIDGKIVENQKKVRDKYTRHKWNTPPHCISTRNDSLAAQNTIHPEEDRVFSIRELMTMMNIPLDFKWIDMDLKMLNSLDISQKKSLYKLHEMNIRQSIGEAVPFNIINSIAKKIKDFLNREKVSSSKIKHLIKNYNLEQRENLIEFLRTNSENIELSSLMTLSELCNTRRKETSAYYTNKFIANEIYKYLPDFKKDKISILEPSVGIGGFLPFIFKKYQHIPEVTLDVMDIDEKSMDILKILISKMKVPKNFKINFIVADFLEYPFDKKYDLAFGNPPFTKLKKADAQKYMDFSLNKETTNLSAFFLEKCLKISSNVALILQKSILSSSEFHITRLLLKNIGIKAILDFGRNGFSGVSIETVCLVLDSKTKPKKTTVYNMKFNKILIQDQDYITDVFSPYFLIYRNTFFDSMLKKMDLGKFDVFRDRQITKSIISHQSGEDTIRVVKARNIDDKGHNIKSIENYDSYIKKENLESLNVFKYFNNTDVYLTPNMTYNPRVMKNIPNIIPDGSVAIMIPKTHFSLTDKQMLFFSTDEYREFYKIARNYSTQSINVDQSSIYFYGVLKNEYQ